MVRRCTKFLFVHFSIYLVSMFPRASAQSPFDVPTDKAAGDDIALASSALKDWSESNVQENNSADGVSFPAEGDITDSTANAGISLILADDVDSSDWLGRCSGLQRWACCRWEDRLRDYICDWLRRHDSGCTEIICCTPDLGGFPNAQCPYDAAEKRDDRRRRYPVNIVPVPAPASPMCRPRRVPSLDKRDDEGELLAIKDC